jgi:Mce-associated membrane protein
MNNNRAVVDPALTQEVTGRLQTVLEQTLSYDYRDLDRTAKAVADNIADKARCQYDLLYGQVQKLALEQKLILTTKVVKLGVIALDRDRARVLAFIDQTTTRADQNQTTASGAQVGIEARRLGGTWKVTNLDLLGQALPNGRSTPSC